MSTDEMKQAVNELYKFSKDFVKKHSDQFLEFLSIAWTFFATSSLVALIAYMAKVLTLKNKVTRELVACT